MGARTVSSLAKAYTKMLVSTKARGAGSAFMQLVASPGALAYLVAAVAKKLFQILARRPSLAGITRHLRQVIAHHLVDRCVAIERGLPRGLENIRVHCEREVLLHRISVARILC